MRIRPENLVILMLASLVGGCEQPADVRTVAGSECVDIPNGQYFQFVDGRLVSATQRDIEDQERPPETARRIGSTLAGMGYPWVALDWNGEVAVVSGLAQDEASRSDAFIAAKSLFEADSVSGPLVQRVVNNMEVREAEDAIAIRLTKELTEEDGLGWLSVVIDRKVATLVGIAGDLETKEAGYSIGRSTVESDLDAGAIINIVVDAISIAGDADPVGAALVELDAPAGLASCQAAFNQVMERRDVAFVVDEAIVERTSSRLLDAVTGVALICEDHVIEIAVRIGSAEGTGDGLDLSQRRASAVRDYLMAYGVLPEALTARGYGRFEDAVSETAFIVRPREF